MAEVTCMVGVTLHCQTDEYLTISFSSPCKTMDQVMEMIRGLDSTSPHSVVGICHESELPLVGELVTIPMGTDHQWLWETREYWMQEFEPRWKKHRHTVN